MLYKMISWKLVSILWIFWSKKNRGTPTLKMALWTSKMVENKTGVPLLLKWPFLTSQKVSLAWGLENDTPTFFFVVFSNNQNLAKKANFKTGVRVLLRRAKSATFFRHFCHHFEIGKKPIKSIEYFKICTCKMTIWFQLSGGCYPCFPE